MIHHYFNCNQIRKQNPKATERELLEVFGSQLHEYQNNIDRVTIGHPADLIAPTNSHSQFDIVVEKMPDILFMLRDLLIMEFGVEDISVKTEGGKYVNWHTRTDDDIMRALYPWIILFGPDVWLIPDGAPGLDNYSKLRQVLNHDRIATGVLPEFMGYDEEHPAPRQTCIARWLWNHLAPQGQSYTEGFAKQVVGRGNEAELVLQISGHLNRDEGINETQWAIGVAPRLGMTLSVMNPVRGENTIEEVAKYYGRH